jgi:hypothetical protein
MGYSKLSVTVPDEVYEEIKELASRRKLKLSHLVTAALAEKTRRLKEEEFVERVNKVFSDPEVVKEHGKMAETIANSTAVEELPW